MILVITHANLVKSAQHKAADGMEMRDISGSGVNPVEAARKADVVVFLDTVRFKVLKDRYGPDEGEAGYITAASERGLAAYMQKWAERYKG